MKEKTILITGGAGFLGSRLCKFLLNAGHYVMCLDNFSTGSFENIQPFIHHQKFKLINHDVVKPFQYNVDEIYNLASPASPVQYQINPVKTLKTNVFGMNHVLELAKEQNAKVLQASTSEVYGDPLVHPQNESYWGNVNPIGARSCYDEGKRCAETLCFDYKRQYGVDVRVVRIFNTYGPNMRRDDGRVISNFITQAIAGRKLTVYGDGSQTRSFCYVDDMVRGLVAMMENEELIAGPVNIGNPEEHTILEIARQIIIMTNSSSKIIFKPLPSDDPKKRRPNIRKAIAELNWQPEINLQDGLRSTIAYFLSMEKETNDGDIGAKSKNLI
jgi:UDP-glucuronate decarboxylase